jgi:hypothetical protein
LSIQEQQVLELISAQVSGSAEAMFLQASSKRPVDEKALTEAYMGLIAGAMAAVAGVRVSYLQSFAAANGKPAFTIPSGVSRPVPQDVLVEGVEPAGAVKNALGLQRKWAAQLADSVEEGIDSAVDSFEALPMSEVERRAALMAGNKLGQLAESTVTSTADYVTRSVLNPDKRVGALRRVVHPSACDRCLVVAGVLTFKWKPALRHDQCRCSFEPVYSDDPQYMERLALYQKNAGTMPGMRWFGTGPFGVHSARSARNTRARGRAQLSAAEQNLSSESVRRLWDKFLQEEEVRQESLVKTIKSNTFKDWDVMVASESFKTSGDFFPLITRS